MTTVTSLVTTALVLLASSVAAQSPQVLWRVAGEGTLLRVVDPLPAGAEGDVPCPQPVAVYVVKLGAEQAKPEAIANAPVARALYRGGRLSLLGPQGEVVAVFAANSPDEKAEPNLLPAEVLGAAWYCPPEGQTPVAYAGELARVLNEPDYDDEALNTGGGGDCISGGFGATSCSITCGNSSCSVGCQAGYYACCKCGLLSGASCTCRAR